jgi:hypothetical protein
MSTIAITAADIALYRRYDGDLDGLSRSGDRDADVSESAWRMIDDLRQRAFIVAAGRGSQAFAQQFEADLAVCIPDVQVRTLFRELVEADFSDARRQAGR